VKVYSVLGGGFSASTSKERTSLQIGNHFPPIFSRSVERTGPALYLIVNMSQNQRLPPKKSYPKDQRLDLPMEG